jgi:hypothetical protein
VQPERLRAFWLLDRLSHLTASVIGTGRLASECQNSISAYFYTSSHSVFVASLFAIAICLITN